MAAAAARSNLLLRRVITLGGATGYYVYVLASIEGRDSRTYVGWTTDVDQRLKRHNDGAGAKSTRGRLWVLLYVERHESRHAAMSREWHLKRDRAFRAVLRQA